jgi:hypothetical protein
MSMIMTREEQLKERDYEKIKNYLESLSIGELLEIIPNVFEVDIEDALIQIILDNQILHINKFGEIVQ